MLPLLTFVLGKKSNTNPTNSHRSMRQTLPSPNGMCNNRMSRYDIITKLAHCTSCCIKNFYALCEGLSNFVEQRDASPWERLNCTLPHIIAQSGPTSKMYFPYYTLGSWALYSDKLGYWKRNGKQTQLLFTSSIGKKNWKQAQLLLSMLPLLTFVLRKKSNTNPRNSHRSMR